MPTKKQPAKKPVQKKAPVKKTAKTRTSKSASTKATTMRSFMPSRPTEPFLTFRITHQTLYWLILAVFVLALGIWVTAISIRVQHIYDSIDATNLQADMLPDPKTAVR